MFSLFLRLFFFCLFFLVFPSTILSASFGVDVSEPISTTAFQCLKGKGFSFAIVRAYRSLGSPDPNAPETVKNAHRAGFDSVGVYMFPCPKCGNPSKQVSDAVAFLHSHNVSYDRFWLDIEGEEYWGTNLQKNHNFFLGLVNATLDHHQELGIYCSHRQWTTLFGDWTVHLNQYPLWYAHYDNNPSFYDFVPFGGWKVPTMKQFYGDATECGVSIDKDWKAN